MRILSGTRFQANHPTARATIYERGMDETDSPANAPLAPPSFLFTARPAQLEPPGDWRTWLFLGGRGAGKTRAGAEWVRRLALFGGHRRIALVAPTLNDLREVMIEGNSGLCAIGRRGEMLPKYEVSRRRLVWPNGAEAYGFSAEDPDSLRGPQFDAAWCDEIAAWRYGPETWDMLQMTLRLGKAPRALATTTPRPVPLVRRLVKDPTVLLTRSSTQANAMHLSPAFLAHIEQAYAGSRLGRQELAGELLNDVEHALWSAALLERARLGEHPGPFADVIVAVDPPATSGNKADACGIMTIGLRQERAGQGRAYVLSDGTVRGLPPADWAARVVAAADHAGASRIVAEANQGGEMVRSMLLNAGCSCPVTLKHARLSKRSRAMPVAALYSQGRVFHLGDFTELEEEMLTFGTEAMQGSPDRVDALVWGVSALLLDTAGEPRIRQL